MFSYLTHISLSTLALYLEAWAGICLAFFIIIQLLRLDKLAADSAAALRVNSWAELGFNIGVFGTREVP
jgi:hypothetical protein